MRVALRFSLAGHAGEHARGLGVLPREFDSMRCIRECFDAWLEKRGGAGSLEEKALLDQVRLFLEMHGQSRFQDWNNQDAVCPNRAGYRKENKYYCFPETFKADIIKGFSLKQAIKTLGAAGWLERQSGAWQSVISCPGRKQRRMYVLNLPDEK